MELIKFLKIKTNTGFMTIAFAFLALNAVGQTPDYVKPMTDQFPKTPDAAALSKFIDIPPGPYNGSNSISIPLYNLESNGEVFPISLDYHLSGVKVGEVASRIGLGWSLNVGNLSLSKQTIGYDDDGFVQTYDPRDFDGDYYGYGYFGIYPEDFIVARRAVGLVHGVTKDTQPDIFSYNVNGHSGKFIRDSSGAIQKIPYNALKIEGFGYPFIFTNNNGTKFFFTKNGYQHVRSASNSGNDSNLYKIDKIVFLNGQEIKFNYRSIHYSYIVNSVQSQTLSISGPCEFEDGYVGAINSQLFITDNHELILSNIVFPNGQIFFNYTDDQDVANTRNDIYKDVACVGITVKNSAEKLIKKFSFQQSYFESQDNNSPFSINFHPSLEALENGLKYRLKLNSVVDQIENTTHVLTYNEQNPLPNRLSPDTDYWGVYNGAENESPIPKILYDNRFYGHANKNPNFIYGVIGSLKTLKLPTGGTQEFIYEQDDYYSSGIDTTYNYQEFKINSQINTFNHDYPFYLNGDIDQVIEFESPQNPLGDCVDCLPISGSSYAYGIILNENKVEILRFYLNKKYFVNLPKNKNYYLKIKKVGSMPITAVLKINWYNHTAIPFAANRKVGTLRIKSILLKSNTGQDIRKTYHYINPETAKSSGVNHGDKITPLSTIYSPGSGVDFSNSNVSYEATGTCTRLLLGSNNGINLSSIAGKSIGYSKVQEIMIDNQNGENLGAIEYKFSNILDDGIQDVFISPLIPREDRSFERGLVLEKKVYNKLGIILNSTYNEYETDSYYNQFSSMYGGEAGIAMCIKIELLNSAIDRYFEFRSRQYSIPSGWVKLLQTKNIDYFNGQEVESITNYTYSPTYKHIFPIKTNTTSSNGSVVETSYVYPPDIPTEPAMADLITDNRIAQPVETSVSINGSKTWQEKIVYAKDSITDTLAMPIAIYAAKFPNNLPLISGIGKLEKKISFNRYKDGKVVEYAVANGVPTTLLWGYNNQKMIAKIENASFSSFQNQYEYIQSTSDNFINLNIFQASLINLRVNLAPPTSMVTTYTHIPLIGISKITDQKNQSATYSYDSAGRLKLVKDNQSKILLENFYNYKP